MLFLFQKVSFYNRVPLSTANFAHLQTWVIQKTGVTVEYMLNGKRSQSHIYNAWPRGYKTFSCSTQLRLKFQWILAISVFMSSLSFMIS